MTVPLPAIAVTLVMTPAIAEVWSWQLLAELRRALVTVVETTDAGKGNDVAFVNTLHRPWPGWILTKTEVRQAAKTGLNAARLLPWLCSSDIGPAGRLACRSSLVSWEELA